MLHNLYACQELNMAAENYQHYIDKDNDFKFNHHHQYFLEFKNRICLIFSNLRYSIIFLLFLDLYMYAF